MDFSLLLGQVVQKEAYGLGSDCGDSKFRFRQVFSVQCFVFSFDCWARHWDLECQGWDLSIATI